MVKLYLRVDLGLLDAFFGFFGWFMMILVLDIVIF